MAVAEATCQNGRPAWFSRGRELQTPAPAGSFDRSFDLFGRGRGMPSSDNWHLYSAAGRWFFDHIPPLVPDLPARLEAGIHMPDARSVLR